MDIKKAIEGIFTGESILFVGSGFSLGATNSNSSNPEMKRSPDLSTAMLSACGISDEKATLTKASEVFLADKGPDELVDFLKREFVVSSISPDQEFVTGQKWRRIYTTNYDNVLEYGCAKNHKTSTPVTLSDSYKTHQQKNTKDLIIHLNGYIQTLTAEKLNNEFKLTNASYLATTFKQSPWFDLLKNDIRVCKSIFFVGFSMDYDLDLSQIIVGAGVKDKTFFVVSDQTGVVDRRCLSTYGEVLPINLSGFVKTIRDVKADYVPDKGEVFCPISFKELHLDKSNVHVSSTDFFEMLIGGEIRFSHIQRAMEDPTFRYAVNRAALEEVQQCIAKKQKHILIESALGNGKTVFMMQIAVQFLLKGIPVFWYEKYTDNVYREIGIISQQYPEAAIILDDYHTAKDIIRSLTSTGINNIIITSERQSYHDAVYEEIQDVLGGYQTISIDRLDEKESAQMDELFAHYSVWGDLSALPEERINYLKNICKSQISLLLLSRIKSSQMTNKLSEAYKSIKVEPRFKNAFIMVLLIEFFRLKVDPIDYSSWIGAEVFNNPLFKRNSGVREFFNMDDYTIKFKSSIVSRYFLHTLIEPEEIVYTLIAIMKILNEFADVNRYYKSMLTTLMNYTQLRNCIDSSRTGSFKHVLQFYDEVSVLPACRDNIHFWLQYAIARLEEKNYTVARLYFEKCYALAKSIKGYLTYKIDNHYSRYLLENSIANDTAAECMCAFRKAHDILIVTYPGDEKTVYSYRMAGLYKPFYQKFFEALSPEERSEFLDKCSEMRNKCIRFIADMESIPHIKIQDVKDTERKLSEILEKNRYVERNPNFRYSRLK